MEIILIMVVAVYALAIALQLKGYLASLKAPKAETDQVTPEAGFMTRQKSV
jgi:hypothetical protein